VGKLPCRDISLKCNRCGKCCSEFWIPISPNDLEQRYVRWLSGENSRNDDMHLLYPMLKFTGTSATIDGVIKYHYSCIHLKQIEDNLYKCSIYAHRPDICRNFPFYGKEIVSIELPKGCAFEPK